MKTPLQKLRQQLKEHQKTVIGKSPYDNGYKCALADVMELIDGIFIPKEKQAIKDAYNKGYRDGESGSGSSVWPDKDISEFDDAEQYYNELLNKQL